MMKRMDAVQQIVYRGQLAAVVVLGEEAIVDAELSGDALQDVQAMCLYAIETAAGERPGVYSEQRALAFAAQARAQRALSRSLAMRDG
jgi:hypothetical protein